jgi:hypothetical protein
MVIIPSSRISVEPPGGKTENPPEFAAGFERALGSSYYRIPPMRSRAHDRALEPMNGLGHRAIRREVRLRHTGIQKHDPQKLAHLSAPVNRDLDAEV